MNHILTPEYLKEVLYYDPETGLFTWIKRLSRGAKIGDIAGCTATHCKAKKKYIVIGIKNKVYLAHRLAWFYMTGKWPKEQIDHADGNGLNNKWDNISESTHAQNCKNVRLRTDNISGCSGVCWHKLSGKWRARISVNKKELSLGLFENKKDAIESRKAAEKKYGYHENHGQVRPL